MAALPATVVPKNMKLTAWFGRVMSTDDQFPLISADLSDSTDTGEEGTYSC